MENENNLGRLLALMILTMVIALSMYGLPDEMLGVKVRKVDMLSDIRVKTKTSSLDSIKQVLAQADTVVVDTAALRESVVKSTGIDSSALVKRETLYRQRSERDTVDVTGRHIEDYSPGHIALKRFFEALNRVDKMDRPVRIAFMGDSFIEGDIVVADFRSALQKEFGGGGVGFVPITSVTSQYRPTVENEAEGWNSFSMLTDRDDAFTLPGVFFEAEDNEARVTMRTTKRYAESSEVSTVKFIYEQNGNTRMLLSLNGGEEQVNRVLPSTNTIMQNVQRGTITEAEYVFTNAKGLRAIGVALEDEEGVIVDNFSLRGNLGYSLEHIDEERSKQLSKIRPYDLIILQYGLNAISEETIEYDWYSIRMTAMVRHLRECFPDTDILMLGVSDRSHQVDGQFETMPQVLTMLHAQRQTARRSGIAFWNTFGAMGGENSMQRFVENGWAGKDYTHMSFRGGREIAKALFEALMKEKDFYDEAEKSLH